MKDKRRIEILLKVIKESAKVILNSQELIDASMVDVCAEEDVSSKQVFFYFDFLCCCLIKIVYPSKRVKSINFLVCVKETAYENSRI